MKSSDLKKYALALIITCSFFGGAFYLASQLNARRIADIRTTESQISIDILSTETQYDLLGEIDCSELSENPILSSELNTLASRLSVAENNLGTDNPEVEILRKQYSLLQIKDLILLQKVSNKCGKHPVYVLYFYSNSGDCPDCSRMGDALTYLRETYPGLRVYAFDYHLNLSALRTLIGLRNIEPQLPALVINNRAPVYGFKTVDQIQKLAPEISKLATTTTDRSTRGGF